MSDSQEYIASVLAKHSWNLIGLSDSGTLGNIKPNTPLTISYSFLTGRPGYYAGTTYGDDFLINERGVIASEVNNFSILSGTQQGVFSDSMAAWSSVANITFTPAQNGQVGDIAIANVKLQSDLAVTSSPGQVTALGVGGDIFINPNEPLNNGLNRGDVGYMTILHELGHALGLEHPIAYNTGDVGPFLTENVNTKYTVMVKYDAKFGGWWTPSKPMLDDILAIQTLYGVNTTDPIVDNTYKFKTGADAIQAIWDNGGIDTIDASDQTVGVTIDLRPGYFSFVGTDENTSRSQIAIAYQVAGQKNNWIENAIGGSGNDELIGNNSKDVLIGGAGADFLSGGADDDRLYGNTEQSFAVLLAAGETGTATGQRGDLLSGDLGSDQLYGSNGNDALAGGDGADTLVGGLGDDVLLGDDNFASAGTNWSVTQQHLQNGQGGLTHSFTVDGAGYQQLTQGGDDLIYGGAGAAM
jgi:serralysin